MTEISIKHTSSTKRKQTQNDHLLKPLHARTNESILRRTSFGANEREKKEQRDEGEARLVLGLLLLDVAVHSDLLVFRIATSQLSSLIVVRRGTYNLAQEQQDLLEPRRTLPPPYPLRRTCAQHISHQLTGQERRRTNQ